MPWMDPQAHRSGCSSWGPWWTPTRPTPMSSLSAGDGLLVVPAGTKVIAYTLSTNP